MTCGLGSCGQPVDCVVVVWWLWIACGLCMGYIWVACGCGGRVVAVWWSCELCGLHGGLTVVM